MSALLKSGDVIGDYVVEELIGIGGMGIVYRAVQRSLNRRVALKVMSPRLLSDERSRERFRREAIHAASLDHPSVVTVYEAGEDDGTPFIAMRYVDGVTLEQLIAGGDLTVDRTLGLLRTVADALDHAHLAGIIHRDVKPQNILIADGDRAFLADFGITKALEGESLTVTGRGLGSLGYVAPEQIAGEQVRSSADIYALTAVLFECLTGHQPFQRDNDAALIHAHLHDPVPQISTFARLPTRLDDVIARGMAKRAQERFGTASELVAAASDVLEHPTRRVPITAEPPESRGDSAPHAQRPTADRETPHEPGAETEEPEPSDAQPAFGAVTRTASQPSVSEPAPRGRAMRATRTADPNRATSSHSSLGASMRIGETEARDSASASDKPTLYPAPWPRRRLVLAGVVVVASLAVGLVAALKQHGSSWSRLNAGPVQLRFGKSWVRTSPADAAINGLLVSNPAALRHHTTSGGGTLSTGIIRNPSPGTDAAPSALRSTFATRKPPQTVTLGDEHALKYTAQLMPARSQTLQLFMVPTSAGYVGIACRGPTSGFARLSGPCADVAASLKLTSSAKRFSPGPSAVFAAALEKVLKPLDAARRRHAPGLRSSATVTRASAARALASDHVTAAAALKKIAVAPQDDAATATMLDAISALGREFQRLAQAANRRDPNAYDVARRSIGAADRQLQSGISALRVSGYRVTGNRVSA